MTSKARRKLWAELGIPPDYARTRHMPVQREARSLVLAARAADDGKPVRLTPSAALAWKRMQATALANGVKLLPISGYRSVARQIRIIRRKLSAGESIDAILKFVAAPGCSEHHTGRAIDIGSPEHCELDEDFAQTAEFKWLRRHAGRFGFVMTYPRDNRHGIGYEPWHWCWHA